MRKISINYPIKLEVVNPEDNYEGYPFLKALNSSDFTVSLLRSGDQLKYEGDKLSLFNYIGNVGGLHRVNYRPPTDGAMPRNFSRPFLYCSSFKENPSNSDFYGNSEKSVKDFLDFKIGEIDDYLTTARIYKSWKLFSYEGDLYVLLEELASTGAKTGRFVNVFKYDQSLDRFNFVHKFSDDPVDVQGDAADIKSGSSDAFEHRGNLYICYRQIDNDECFIVIKKNLSKDLLEWETVSKVLVQDTIINQTNSFRLRAKSSGESIMFAFMATLERFAPPPGGGSSVRISDLKEFRSYVSFDNCKSFKTKEKTYKNIDVSTQGDYIIRDDTGNVFNYFVPYFGVATTWDSNLFNDININFDLYYDKTMGSFVILKGGDPEGIADTEGFVNPIYLMGIKTSDASYLDWEPCLRMPITSRVTGSGPSFIFDKENPQDSLQALQKNWLPYSEGAYKVIPSAYSYKIYDVCVVPGETVNDLFLSVYETGTLGNDFSSGVVSTEFSFVDDSLIASGFYDQVQAYGGKYHERYSFFSSLINCEIGALSSVGYKTSAEKNQWTDVTACSWRNQIVATAKEIPWAPPTFMAVLGVYSNLGESSGYELAYASKSGKDLPDLGFQYTSANSTVEYTPRTGTRFNIPQSTSYRYVTISEYPSILTDAFDFETNRTPVFRIAENKYKNFKLKLRFKIDGFSELPVGSNISIYQMDIGSKQFAESFSRMSFSLFLTKVDSSKYIISMNGVQAFENVYEFENGKMYDLLICNNKFDLRASDDYYIRFYAKEAQSDTWAFIGERKTIENSSDPFAVSFIRIGILSTLTAAPGGGSRSNYFLIKDLHISTYGSGYRTIYGYSKKPELNLEPHMNFGENNSTLTCLPTKSFSRDIETFDGSKLRINGGRTRAFLNSYRLNRSITKNKPDNVINGFANSSYDFTRIYQAEQSSSIIFKNKFKDKFDILSLINLNGVYAFTLSSGDYNEATKAWSNLQEQYYVVPYVELTFLNQEDDFIMVEEEFEPSQLVGHSLFVYNETTGDYDYHFIILENFESFIKLDRELPNLSGKKIRMAKNSMSFAVPDDIGDGKPYSMISFLSPSSSSLRSLGEIVLGRWIDFSGLHLDTKDNVSSNSNVIESNSGNLFTGRVDKGNVYTQMDINFTNLSKPKGEYQEIVDSLYSLYRKDQPFPLIEFHDDGQLTAFGTLGKNIKASPKDFYQDLTMSMYLQHWRAVSNDTYVQDNLDFEISASSYLPSFSRLSSQSETVNFQANPLNFNPSEGYEFRWSFGDDSDDIVSQSPSHVYLSPGNYSVMCKLIKDEKVLAFRRLRIQCIASPISDYNLSEPSKFGSANQIVLSVRDVEDQLVLDSFTSFEIEIISSDPDWVFLPAFKRKTNVTLQGGLAYLFIRYNGFADQGLFSIDLGIKASNGDYLVRTVEGLSNV
jgi:hypothetical protein